MNKRQWRPVTADEYERELRDTCDDIEKLRDDVRARYTGLGATAAAPRLAADLRALRAEIVALRSGPGLDG
jgi:hypothetical protein